MLGLFIFVNSEWSQSPLDERGKPPQPSFWPYGINYSKDQLPECIGACVNKMIPVISTIFQTGSNRKRIVDSCSAFDHAEECMNQLTHCPRNEIYIALSNGVRYMCKEQRQAFDANAPCMDKVNDKVYSECDAHCHPGSLVNGFAIKDAFTNGFTKGLDFGFVHKFIDPHLTKLFISESCRIAQCLLQCFRNKFNIHCDGIAGSLLTEAIIRPFDSRVQSLPIGAVVKSFLPTQCKFMYDGMTIKKFRIDPELDKEIKRMYGSGTRQVKTTEERVVESINNYDRFTRNPFDEASNMIMAASESPIDTGFKSLSRARRNNAHLWHSPFVFGKSRLSSNPRGPSYHGHLNGPSPLNSAHDAVNEELESSGSGLEDVFEEQLTPTWQSVEDVKMNGSGSEVIEIGSQPDANGVTSLHLERSLDNADLFLAQWIQPDRTYNINVNVKDEDEGELICLLRTYKGFGINKLSDTDLDNLVDEIEKV